MDGLEEFITVSERLTGHTHTELVGTGSAHEYLLTLKQAVPDQAIDDLLASAGQADAESSTANLLADPCLGPVARNLIVLWYCGTWQELDAEWRQTYNAPAVETHVVSANAYLSGLQWTVAEAHAPGGNAQGFGAWATRPESLTERQNA